MTIRKFGNELLTLQSTLGLPNSSYYCAGLTKNQAARISFLRNVPEEFDLFQLFLWHNGVFADPTVPMHRLWISPGWFMLSASESEMEREYLRSTSEGWMESWIPLFSDGSIGRLFYDLSIGIDRQGPVFYSLPDSPTKNGQIYDTLAAMFHTLTICYSEGAFFLSAEGILDEDLQAVTNIAKGLNPDSDFWRREDLF